MAPDSNRPGDNWDEVFRAGTPRESTDADSAPDSGPAPAANAVSEEAPVPTSRREARQSERRSANRTRTPGKPGPEQVDDDRIRAPRKRRKGWIIALAVVVVLLGGAAGGTAWAWANYEDQIRKVMGWELPIDYEGQGHGEASIVIRSGDGGEVIAASLAEAGVTKTAKAFYQLLLKQDPPVVFFPGHYLLKQEMSAQAALDALQDPANKVEISVLIKEGWSVKRAIAELSEGTGIPVADFEAAIADPTAYGVPADAPSLEGYLFPARYNFEPDAEAPAVINTLVARTFQSLDAAGVPAAERHRVLTIASLVQREAGSNPDDFYKVSRVIQNRLAANMLLQFDSSAHYGYAWKHGERQDGSVFSSSAELQDDNPYNTYVHTGLPIGPIGAAGDLAIEAAQKPADGPWLYFVTVNLETGETKFTNTNAEHNAAVEELRAWCRQTQSPNCD